VHALRRNHIVEDHGQKPCVLMGSNQVAREGAGAAARSVLSSPTPDEAAMERAYSPTAIPVEYAFASTRAGTLRSRVPRGTRDARRRAIGEAMAKRRNDGALLRAARQKVQAIKLALGAHMAQPTDLQRSTTGSDNDLRVLEFECG
jgi:hypothetical protein